MHSIIRFFVVFYFFFFFNFVVAMVIFVPLEFGSLSPGKTSCDRLALPNFN